MENKKCKEVLPILKTLIPIPEKGSYIIHTFADRNGAWDKRVCRKSFTRSYLINESVTKDVPSSCTYSVQAAFYSRYPASILNTVESETPRYRDKFTQSSLPWWRAITIKKFKSLRESTDFHSFGPSFQNQFLQSQDISGFEYAHIYTLETYRLIGSYTLFSKPCIFTL